VRKRGLKVIAQDVPVTGYVDYRDYLGELYKRAKESTSPYSYEAFAEDLGFGPINTFRLVITRQRLLSDKSAATVAKSLGLLKENRRYFLAMVRHINARSPKMKAAYFHKMLEAKQQSIVSHRDKEQMSFLSEWYHWVVLELLRLDGGVGDPQRLSEQLYPAIGADKIKRSLALLEALGLVKVDAATRRASVALDSPMLVPSDAAVGHLAMTRHHQSMLDQAKHALDTVPSEERDFNTVTIALSEANFAELMQRARDFCAAALELESRPQTRERVAQVNLNVFAMSRPWSRKSEGDQ
jgi:uncharacterized protein (TIGR02147 family)